MDAFSSMLKHATNVVLCRLTKSGECNALPLVGKVLISGFPFPYEKVTQGEKRGGVGFPFNQRLSDER